MNTLASAMGGALLAVFLTACGTTPATTPTLDAGHDIGADAEPDVYDVPVRLGCYPEHDGRSLAESRIDDDGQSGCCDYWSRDYQQRVVWCVDGLHEVEDGSPFYAVEVNDGQ